ncbi:MAG: NAD-dependent epimerase/dehydratase family protein [Bacteroidetes bacterium]|nr:NAD-dependent epimerase/dehydratase family protein [Bacteroidota bacterium]
MKIILTGATGMVGEGVLLECLRDPRITSVLSISRKPSGKSDPKLTELLVDDFMDIGNYKDRLRGYDACFYCAGISSVGMTEEAYLHITYTLTVRFAEVLLETSPQLVFIFVSGGHTDSTEKGKVMWARVKGKTENALGRIPFKAQYSFRPALMKPDKEQVHLKGYNKYLRLLYPIMRLFLPGCTMAEIGHAMINTVQKGYSKRVLEVKDIKQAAHE